MLNEPALDPESRSLYGDNLKPPPGYQFDGGVATTFSLDFETTLAVPVSLALFAAPNREEVLRSPIALLESIERTADKLAIFAEAGRIHAEEKAQPRLCSLLEESIAEVCAPRGGSFHPKLWVLRYRPIDIANEVTLIRLIILSRNLTKDRSWDLSLCIDGNVQRANRRINRPLFDLITRLPSLVVSSVSERVRSLTRSIADDLHKTRWVLAPGWEELRFDVHGIGRKPWRLQPCSRLGIVSPFCDESALSELVDAVTNDRAVLVSRGDELAPIRNEVLARFEQILVLDEVAEFEDGEELDGAELADDYLRGLHAKVYIAERGWDTSITVGSANATRPGLFTGANVEVLATIRGKRSKLGSVSEILGEDGFGRLLRSYISDEGVESDPESHSAELRTEAARRAIAQAGLTLQCVAVPEPHTIGGEWALTIRAPGKIALDGIVELSAWPITRGRAHQRDLISLKQGGTTGLGSMSLVDVSRFVAFHLVDHSGKAEALFTLGLPISGVPAERDSAIFRHIIDSREAFFRYVLLLLAEMTDPLAAALLAQGQGNSGQWSMSAGKGDMPILEDMVRALNGGEQHLRAVARLMQRLETEADENTPSVVPDDFIRLWRVFGSVLEERSGAGE